MSEGFYWSVNCWTNFIVRKNLSKREYYGWFLRQRRTSFYSPIRNIDNAWILLHNSTVFTFVLVSYAKWFSIPFNHFQKVDNSWHYRPTCNVDWRQWFGELPGANNNFSVANPNWFHLISSRCNSHHRIRDGHTDRLYIFQSLCFFLRWVPKKTVNFFLVNEFSGKTELAGKDMVGSLLMSVPRQKMFFISWLNFPGHLNHSCFHFFGQKKKWIVFFLSNADTTKWYPQYVMWRY